MTQTMDTSTIIILLIAGSGVIAIGAVIFKILAIIALIRAWFRTAATVSLLSATGLGAAVWSSPEDGWMRSLASHLFTVAAADKSEDPLGSR